MCQLEHALRAKHDADIEVSEMKAYLTACERDKEDMKKFNKDLNEKLCSANDAIASLQSVNEIYEKKLVNKDMELLKAVGENKSLSERLFKSENN